MHSLLGRIKCLKWKSFPHCFLPLHFWTDKGTVSTTTTMHPMLAWAGFLSQEIQDSQGNGVSWPDSRAKSYSIICTMYHWVHSSHPSPVLHRLHRSVLTMPDYATGTSLVASQIVAKTPVRMGSPHVTEDGAPYLVIGGHPRIPYTHMYIKDSFIPPRGQLHSLPYHLVHWH